MTDERNGAGEGDGEEEDMAAAGANELVLGVDRSRCKVRRCGESFLDIVGVFSWISGQPLCACV